MNPASIIQILSKDFLEEREVTQKKLWIELELFPVTTESTKRGELVVPSFDGERGIEELLRIFADQSNWEPIKEEGRIIALKNEQELITLEPSGIVEYVSAPCDNLIEVKNSLSSGLAELKLAGQEMGISFLQPAIILTIPKANCRSSRKHAMSICITTCRGLAARGER